MRLGVDDLAYQVNDDYLGPKGRTFYWTARYVAYYTGIVIFVMILQVERWMGLHVGLWVYVYDLVVTVWLTRTLGVWIDYDRPLRSMCLTFGHELRAPRHPRRKRPESFAVTKVRVRDLSPVPVRHGFPRKTSRQPTETETVDA